MTHEEDLSLTMGQPAVPDEVMAARAAKAVAIRQAMIEVMQEQRDEIIRRARAKLVGMGHVLTDEEAAKL